MLRWMPPAALFRGQQRWKFCQLSARLRASERDAPLQSTHRSQLDLHWPRTLGILDERALTTLSAWICRDVNAASIHLVRSISALHLLPRSPYDIAHHLQRRRLALGKRAGSPDPCFDCTTQRLARLLNCQ